MKHNSLERAAILAQAAENARDLMLIIFIGSLLIIAFWTLLWMRQNAALQRDKVQERRDAKRRENERLQRAYARQVQRAMRFKRLAQLRARSKKGGEAFPNTRAVTN